MEASREAGHQPPAGSTMTVFTFAADDEPSAVVIGPSHPPYYVYPDGHTEEVAPAAAETRGRASAN
jgi:hypothetical protein